MIKKILCGIITVIFLSQSTLYAKENSYTDNLSVGVQSSGLSSTGLSVKYALNDKFTLQGILGMLGTVSNYSARAIYNFKQDDNFKYYGYGSVGVWKYSDYLANETSMGFGIGAGLNYDVRKLDKTLPPLFLSAEIGFDFINFSYYSYGGLGVGFGVHYKF